MDSHVIEFLPAYALDCLSEAEARSVADHLATCESCRAELEAYRATVARLALAVPQIEPPAKLKGRLLKQIRAPRGGQAKVAPRLSGWERFLDNAPRLTPAWGLASLALILVLAVGNLLLWQRLDRFRGMSDAQPMRIVALKGSENTPEASGLIVISHDGKYGTLVVGDLPSLDAGRQYQLWLMKGGKRDSGAIFSVDTDGYISLEVHAPEPLGNYSAFDITIEPKGGSSHPTGASVLSGEP
jgi:anti-sigma-K factor RskA